MAGYIERKLMSNIKTWVGLSTKYFIFVLVKPLVDESGQSATYK